MNTAIRKKSVGFLLTAILLLSFAATVQSFATAQDPSDVTDVTAEQAYKLIKRHSSNILILDVRNQTEYTFAHLYNALQIPCHQLEILIEVYTANPSATIMDWRSIKLMSHINGPVIVYCGNGSRSTIACNILAEKGFTEVFNVIGGIEAWLEADLPIYNTAHKITVEKKKTTIDPLTSLGCTTCGQQNSSSAENLIDNLEVSDIYQSDNYTETHVTFEFNNTMFDNTVSVTSLWNYLAINQESNVTATLESILSVGDLSSNYYMFRYKVQNPDYNFSVTSKLELLDIDTYNASATFIDFVPVGKPELMSIEVVNFTAPVTLSRLYWSLQSVCKDLAGIYKKDGNKYNENTLKNLADNYKKMADELKDISTLIKKELRDYDKEILQNFALLSDDSCSDCLFWCNLFIELIECNISGVILGALVCGSLAPTGIGAIICAIIFGLVWGAICSYGVPPYCENICEWGGYCTPQTTYIDTYAYSETWGQGIINNPTRIEGSPDGSFAQIYGPNNGDGGAVVGFMSASSHGDIVIRMGPMAEQQVYVYLIIDGNWELVYSEQLNSYPQDYFVYYMPANFDVIAIASWDPNLTANLYIDSVTVTG